MTPDYLILTPQALYFEYYLASRTKDELMKMATATKDMWVASLVEPRKDNNNSVPVIEFLSLYLKLPK